MQMLYDKVWMEYRDGQIVQAYSNLASVQKDEASTMKAAGMIGIEKFGP